MRSKPSRSASDKRAAESPAARPTGNTGKIFTRGLAIPSPLSSARNRSYASGAPAISVAVTIGSSPRASSARIARTARRHVPAPRTRSFVSASGASRLTRISSEYRDARASAASASAVASVSTVPFVSTVVAAMARLVSSSGRISRCRKGSPPVK